MQYKINDLIKVEETGQIGHVEQINEETGQVESIRDLKTGELVDVADKTLRILSMVKWIIQALIRLF